LWDEHHLIGKPVSIFPDHALAAALLISEWLYSIILLEPFQSLHKGKFVRSALQR
jgi:hypothetical protein